MTAYNFKQGRFAAFGMALALSGCGGMNLNIWPLNDTKNPGEARKYANASEYKCAAGRSFFLRTLDGNAVWVIYPDRQVRLDKLPGAGNRYGNGVDVLTLNGEATTLGEGTATTYTACKSVGS